MLSLLIDIYGTRVEEDDSDECEVAHERSEGAKKRVLRKTTEAKLYT